MSQDGPLRTTPTLDSVAAGIYLGLTLSETWFYLGQELSRGTQVAGSVALVLMAAAVASRSTRPVQAYFAHGLLILVAIALGMPGNVYPFGNLFLLATMASVAAPAVAWAGLATGVAGIGAYFWRFDEPLLLSGFTMALWALAWVAGRAAHGRRRELVLAHDRDLSRATAEAQAARLALETQRRDIAREIHDLVGHTINVMVIHAGAGRRGLDRDPAEARRALSTIEEVGGRRWENWTDSSRRCPPPRRVASRCRASRTCHDWSTGSAARDWWPRWTTGSTVRCHGRSVPPSTGSCRRR